VVTGAWPCRKCRDRPARPRSGTRGPWPELCEWCEDTHNRRRRGVRGRRRPPSEDESLTASQRSYLDAFDRHLRGEPGARELMTERLGPVLAEAGLDPNDRRDSRRFRRTLVDELEAAA
jgi:hypothetical protein